MNGIRHMRAADMNATWIGWQITATDRATGRTVTGGLSDYAIDAGHGHVWLFMGGQTVELRADDTVTAGHLDVPGAA